MNTKLFKIIFILILSVVLFFNNCTSIFAFISNKIHPHPNFEQVLESKEPVLGSISGNVWKDNKNTINSYGIKKGDGIYQPGETLISNITVNLYKEQTENNFEIVQTTQTSSNGSYCFYNAEDGKYKVEFVYGNSKYNGQNYKSTLSEVNYFPTPTEIIEEDVEEPPPEPIDITILIDTSGSMKSRLVAGRKYQTICNSKCIKSF